MSNPSKKTAKRGASKPRTNTNTAWFPTVGDAVIIRTVTHYHVGRIAGIDDKWLALDEASWVADTGRFHAALASGVLAEVEPFGVPMCIAWGCIVDVARWQHALPAAVK